MAAVANITGYFYLSGCKHAHFLTMEKVVLNIYEFSFNRKTEFSVCNFHAYTGIHAIFQLFSIFIYRSGL